MANNVQVERLTPFDLLMPRIYIVITLTFRTKESTASVAQHLQPGLNALVKELPWLSGRVFLTPAGQQGKTPAPELRWNPSDAALTLIDKGSIEASYETASANGMTPSALPTDTWPVGMIDSSSDEEGAPVFAASLFRFADNEGVGLCICVHHYAVDATGMGDITRLWAHNVANPRDPVSISSGPGRSSRLLNAISPSLPAASSKSIDDIYASHPEYTRTPPFVPSEFPSCAFKLFKIPLAHILERRESLKDHMQSPPTTNTVLCALVWSAITKARLKRDTSVKASQLVLAVNTRGRIKHGFSTPEDPFFGNAVLCAQSRVPVTDLSPETDEGATRALVAVCEAIGASTQRIDPSYVAEVYSLVERTEDFRTIFAGWDLFGARDLTITSWAGLDLYETDFGAELGKPEFIRIPPSEIDSICGVLPRRRAGNGASAADEMLEVIVTLRTEDMAALEGDAAWQSFAKEI